MVIDGCPYKENQKERAWETGLSTTASQISTLQSTVAGKADAGTEITGGAFSDGTLTLMKQDGTGVDIPLPESDLPPVLNLNNSNFITTLAVYRGSKPNVQLNQATEDVIGEWNSNVWILANGGYGGGSCATRILKNISTINAYIDVSLKLTLSGDCSDTSATFMIVSQTIYLGIEDGSYRVPIDILYCSSSGTSQKLCRKINSKLEDNDYLYFTVTDNNVTLTNPSINLNLTKFKTNDIISGNIQRLKFFVDRIEKVN